MDEQAFLQAIFENPDDETLQLIYAGTGTGEIPECPLFCPLFHLPCSVSLFRLAPFFPRLRAPFLILLLQAPRFVKNCGRAP
jgi:hypothetical protein